MNYKPTYCSNCGDKIDRVEWFPWTSRNFCQVCQEEHKIFDKFPLILISIIGVILIFNIGSYLLADNNSVSSISEDQSRIKTLKQKNPPKNERVASNQNGNLPIAGNPDNRIEEQNEVSGAKELPKPEVQQNQRTTVRQTENVPIVKAEPVYFCGAQTKKGTPCSRKVKGGGRCWQHEGKEAMLPPEKLLISR